MTSFLTTGGMRGHNKNMIAKFYPRTHNMGVKKEIFDKYSQAVATQFHLTLDEMFSKTKRQDIVEARQILYYL